MSPVNRRMQDWSSFVGKTNAVSELQHTHKRCAHGPGGFKLKSDQKRLLAESMPYRHGDMGAVDAIGVQRFDWDIQTISASMLIAS